MGSLSKNLGPDILLFGPQVASFSSESITHINSAIRHETWAVDALASLPSIWPRALAKIPNLRSIPGDWLLAQLQTWLTETPPTSRALDDWSDGLPNTLLAPLTTILQLIQYRRYVHARYPNELDPHTMFIDTNSANPIYGDSKTVLLGFCTGLLAVFATASAGNAEEWNHNAAVAICLAALTGMVIDASDATHCNGRAQSYGTAWQGGREGKVQLEAIVSHYVDDAYVSVWFDENRATVTVSQLMAPSLLTELKQAGITATPMQLRGRFHSDAENHHYIEELIQICDEQRELLSLPTAERLLLPTHANSGRGRAVQTGSLHVIALTELLGQQCDWYNTLSTAIENIKNPDSAKRRLVSLSTGPGVPPSLVRSLRLSIKHFPQLEEKIDMKQFINDESIFHEGEVDRGTAAPFPASQATPSLSNGRTQLHRPADDCDIAIVGMSIKVAGADDPIEYESILRDGISQHVQVPRERVPCGYSPRRNSGIPETTKWYGNFVRDADSFDHKFFRRSPRESSAMDPQQRLLLEAAYQAVEQSGYYSSEAHSTTELQVNKHIGVYLGVCATDYDDNAACHPAGAFTVTGLLRGFISGRISHFFGWTGPSMTFDTACSGSAVAIHSAVRAIRSGECSAALAGGVNLLGKETWFQNLAGARFLSPTGQCKPFDEGADGYCRGEGISCVFLKSMPSALVDGNQIFGRIASTAVYQNDNSVPMFVPHAPSLSHLFRDVIQQAELEPHDISLVEAHGTGTPVGDSAEYEAIRMVLGGSIRQKPISLGSVKGLVGHTESASGVVSLIKVILMMQASFIPPQPSHSTLSHRLNASPASDMVEVLTKLQPWREKYKAALINNYGASGSNAAMVVTLPPSTSPRSSILWPDHASLPFRIFGFDIRSVIAYSAKLVAFLTSDAQKKREAISLVDVSFNLSRQSNRTLPYAFLLRCNTMDDLVYQLSTVTPQKVIHVKPTRPVILCFGGQSSRLIDFDRRIYDAVPLIRHNLDSCDSIIQSLGLKSIYPKIFLGTAIQDPVHLQTMLFSVQYSCARSWIVCGLDVTAVVGHSFGEITALCVAQVLDLSDGIKLVAERAKIINDYWSLDRGAMMAVEGDFRVVQHLLEESNQVCQDSSPASIACYNGPQSFTVAGSSPAMDQVALTLSSSVKYASLKSKRLDVSHAFHSALVDPLLPSLEHLGSDLIFHSEKLRVERATEAASAVSDLGSNFVANHMRMPVFFHHAVQRLAQDYPSAIWIEAGSNSKITSMARRSLSSNSQCRFHGIRLTNGEGLEQLSAVTLSLWEDGLKQTFWPHYGPRATSDHRTLLLPPYQFEKSRHWLDLKPLLPAIRDLSQLHDDRSRKLWSFSGYEDAERRSALFKINTEAEEYKVFVLPHVAVQTAPICPATLEYNMAIQALYSIHDGATCRDLYPIVREMRNEAPLCINSSQTAWLKFDAAQDAPSRRKWHWKIMTTTFGQQPDDSNKTTVCVRGMLELCSVREAADEFAKYGEFVTHDMCVSILHDDDGIDSGLQGYSIYRSLADVIDYGALYRRVRRVVGRGNDSAGVVNGAEAHDISGYGSWLGKLPVEDAYSQVAGVWVNCMANPEPVGAAMFLATGCDAVLTSPELARDSRRCSEDRTWHVLAKHRRESEKTFTTNVFVFDASDGRLVEILLGIRYDKISKSSMSRLLVRLTDSSAVIVASHTEMEDKATKFSSKETAANVTSSQITPSPCQILKSKIRDVVATVSGIEKTEIKDESELTDLGIDSLAGMELAGEIEKVFECHINMSQLVLETSTRFSDFAAHILTIIGVSNREVDLQEPSIDDDIEGSSSSGSITQITMATPSSSDPSSPIDGNSGDVSEPIQPRIDSAISNCDESQLSQLDILDAFATVKASTDQRLKDAGLAETEEFVLARSAKLCVALVVEAFDQLGSPLRMACPGQLIETIEHSPQHSHLVNWMYSFLEKEGRLIDSDNKDMRRTRTANSVPRQTSEAILQEMLRTSDGWAESHKLTYYAGKNLADVIGNKKDGIHILFRGSEGRDLVRGLYCDLPFNRLFYEQVRDLIFMVIKTLPPDFHGPFRIVEMGAGTGGTTQVIAPILSSLNVPVEYTITDLSPSMVAQARRTFAKRYPFMRFLVHDIEKPPTAALQANQHVVIASNAVHATANLAESASNMCATLRPDGILLLTEMTESLPFVNLVFGLLEGWWRFADGRRHAIVSAEQWETALRCAGFRHVDWTDGSLPENRIQRVIMALACDLKDKQPDMRLQPASDATGHRCTQKETRRINANSYVARYSSDFMASMSVSNLPTEGVNKCRAPVFIITGGTGSLGSHLVARFAEDPTVAGVVCLNRKANSHSSSPPLRRQQEALSSRGISLSSAALSKLQVFASDTREPHLGLSSAEYAHLVQTVTHIIHNAWPMSATRPLAAFEPQFQSLRRLLDLAADIALSSSSQVGSLAVRPPRVCFQLVSSIGVVGQPPPDQTLVLEERVPLDSVLQNGYSEAKWVCERLLDETLHRHQDRFRAMVVRPGQIAGSAVSGVWNPFEHFPFLVRSAQALRAFPALKGRVQWVPVDTVAGTMAELALGSDGQGGDPIYHIENPVGQSWSDMVSMFTEELKIPKVNIVPFSEWIRRVRRSPLDKDVENPARRLTDFFEKHFERMSCNGVVLDTTKARAHSPTLAAQGPVPLEVARRYIRSWKATGFLNK
ncbi:hypothetical protein QQS21_011075 [Conoideocrella luteorostrata]|uniref:Polyketide synthase n=1 Tax=Conoideocrella luteorostrata TaxID=1105319 RepID=A0AAJ0CDS2_9HYPO|nr:hypothetical protein QQS21_011075 [Conoideocrella luteorostrata]